VLASSQKQMLAMMDDRKKIKEKMDDNQAKADAKKCNIT
jgi:hypothetical protein